MLEDFFLDKTVYCGRPNTAVGREDFEIAVYDYLDKLNIEYKRVDHSPADSKEKCEEIGKLINMPYFKNLFLRNRCEKEFVLLLMLGDKPYNATQVSTQLKTSRLSFCSPEQMKDFLGVTPGSVTLMALINENSRSVKVAIDADILKGEYIRCHPCKNTSTLLIKTKDIIDKFLPSTGHDFVEINI